jgi:hypothetical protein
MNVPINGSSLSCGTAMPQPPPALNAQSIHWFAVELAVWPYGYLKVYVFCNY